jgi:putative membrane protein
VRTRVYRAQWSSDPRPPTWQRLALRLAANAAGLWLAAAIVPGIDITGWGALLGATLVFATLNTLLRPLAVFVSCCLVLATFGLFLLVINAALLALTAWAAGQLGLTMHVAGFWSALGGAVVISAVSLLASSLTRRLITQNVP